MNQGPYVSKGYLAISLDPIHVGTGEQKMARVDKSIVREPSTDLPKVPATSIAGSLRAYVGLHYADRFMREGAGRLPSNCAEDPGMRFCMKPDCPICVIFGFPEGEKGKRGFMSMVQFFDAHIAFFPVRTMVGPVWVTSPAVLGGMVESGLLPEDGPAVELGPDENGLQTDVKGGKLNLGWVLLDVRAGSSPLSESGRRGLKGMGVPGVVLDRLVLVPDKLFGQVVNSNLEVRTSTAIDPFTGSSLEGALFTYEAIPRSTVFAFSAIYKDPRNFQLGGQKLTKEVGWVVENVEMGMKYWEFLGIGGMVTRGMGRMRVLNA
ncbi:MAG: type III-B CRISPR module RAMP protein Cmr4 [Candidatus Latescibacterota bacterium]|nr:MAG: type III-B CRISPR module RAMP protein Cmr4 [Candidatus Latescibacterota bacterium]